MPMVAVISAGTPIPREPLQIHCIVDFTAPDSSDKVVQAFRDGWKALRLLKSPDIAATFGDGSKHYDVPSSQELEAWLNDTFMIAPTGTSVQTVIRDMYCRLEWRPVCYILPQSTGDGTFEGTIIFFISHWRTEAAGALRTLKHLFDYAADLLTGTSTRDALSSHTIGSEVQLLTPALEDILMPDQQQSSAETKARVKARFDEFYSKFPSIDFPIRPSSSDISPPLKVAHRTYSPASTSSMVQACKGKGITVTSAIHAAFLGAVWDLAEPSKQNRFYASMMPAEVRKRLPPSSALREQGCWNAAQMLLLTVPAGQGFLKRAETLKQQYGLADDATWLHEDLREMSLQMMQPPANLPPEPQPVAGPWFTSLGVLDGDVIVSQHGGIQVENVTAWADTTGPGIVLRLWTFRGKLTIQIQWSVAFHADAQIKEILDIIDRILAAELGVEMVIEQDSVAEY